MECSNSSVRQILFYFPITIYLFEFCVLPYNDSRDGGWHWDRGRKVGYQKVPFFQQIGYLAAFVPLYVYHTGIMLLQVTEKNFPRNWGNQLFSFIFYHFPATVWWVIGAISPKLSGWFFICFFLLFCTHQKNGIRLCIEYRLFVLVCWHAHASTYMTIAAALLVLHCREEAIVGYELKCHTGLESSSLWFHLCKCWFLEVCLYAL